VLFTTLTLRRAFAANPSGFMFHACRSGPVLFRGLWERLGNSLPDGSRMPVPDLPVTVQRQAALTTLIVRLPAPERPGEAHLAAFVAYWDESQAQPLSTRYFTLEFTVSASDGSDYDQLWEWTSHSRIDHGVGPRPDESAFLDALVPISATSDRDHDAEHLFADDDPRNLTDSPEL
jgi:hypothetical protein